MRQFTINTITGCWEWTGSLNAGGYAHIIDDAGNRQPAHRAAYEIFKGSVPVSLEIDHLCRVRHCVNPDHLEAVTKQENIRRGEAGLYMKLRAAFKTHCKRGHALSADNVYVRPDGFRACRTCLRAGARQWKAKVGYKSDNTARNERRRLKRESSI